MTPSTWPTSAAVALVVGASAWLLLLFPLVFAQYRRYGDLSASRLAGSAALSLYAAALAAYTLLPLPPHSEQWCQVNGTLRVQATPGFGIKRALWLYTQLPLRSFITNHSVIQLVLNVVLFAPWGVFARKFLGYGVFFTILTGGLISVFIEATQYTGLWWIFPCRWRVVDVDDVIVNTVGTVIGVLLAPLLMWWMPVAQQLAAERSKPRPITTTRRYIAMIFDVAVFLVAVILADLLARTLFIVIFDHHAPFGGLVEASSLLVAWLTAIVLPAAIQGVSLGENTVYLRAVRTEAPAGLGTWLAMGRVSAISLPIVLSLILALASESTQAGLALAGLLALGSLLTVFLSQGEVSVGDKVVSSRVLDTRSPSPAAHAHSSSAL